MITFSHPGNLVSYLFTFSMDETRVEKSKRRVPHFPKRKEQ